LGVECAVLGFAIGAVSGVIQFYLLMKFTGSLTKGKFSGKTAIFAVTQFLFPFAVLLLCAFFLDENLMWIGIGMASALIISAVTRFVIVSRSDTKAGKKGKKKK